MFIRNNTKIVIKAYLRAITNALASGDWNAALDVFEAAQMNDDFPKSAIPFLVACLDGASTLFGFVFVEEE